MPFDVQKVKYKNKNINNEVERRERHLSVVVELHVAGGFLEVVNNDDTVQALAGWVEGIVLLEAVAHGLDELLVGPSDLIDDDDENVSQLEDDVLKEVLGRLLAHDRSVHEFLCRGDLGLLLALLQQPLQVVARKLFASFHGFPRYLLIVPEESGNGSWSSDWFLRGQKTG